MTDDRTDQLERMIAYAAGSKTRVVRARTSRLVPTMLELRRGDQRERQSAGDLVIEYEPGQHEVRQDLAINHTGWAGAHAFPVCIEDPGTVARAIVVMDLDTGLLELQVERDEPMR